MKKRAASEVISTVLLIMIALVLAIIIWNFSKNIISNQTSQTEGSSYYYNAKIMSAEFRETGIIQTTGPLDNPQSINEEELELAVQRLDNELNVTGVRFTFETSDGASYSKSFYENPPNDPKIRIYLIKNTEIAGISSFQNVTAVHLKLIYGNNKATDSLDESEVFRIAT